MAIFTSVAAKGTEYLTEAILTEINDACSERINVTLDYAKSTVKPDVSTGAEINTRNPIFAPFTDVNYFDSLVKNVRKIVGDYYFGVSAFWGWILNAPSTHFTLESLTYSSDLAWLQAIGLTSGWRQAFSYNPSVNDWTDRNDPMYTSNNTDRSLSYGEIVGPWLIEDMQVALNALKHYVYINTASDYGLKSTDSTNNEYTGFTFLPKDSYLLAQAAAVSGGSYSNSTNSPTMTTKGSGFWDEFDDKYQYTANFTSIQNRQRVASSGTGAALRMIAELGGTIRWCGRALEPTVGAGGTSEFSNNGFDLTLATTPDTYSLYSTTTEAASADPYFYSDMLGSASVGDWAATPAPDLSGDSALTAKGFRLSGRAFIQSPNFTHTL